MDLCLTVLEAVYGAALSVSFSHHTTSSGRTVNRCSNMGVFVTVHFLTYLLCSVAGVSGLTGIFATCPVDVTDPSSHMTITIKSDEKIWEAFAFCEPSPSRLFGSYQFDSHNDTVTKSIQVRLDSRDPNTCRFIKTPSWNEYVVHVEIYFPFGDLPYQVICGSPELSELRQGGANIKGPDEGDPKDDAVDAVALSSSVGLNITDLEEAPRGKFIHVPKGGPAQSDLALYLVDVKNQPVGEREWRFGRYLKLAAELVKPRDEEVSFQVHTCMALAVGSKQRQYILTQGCGDGVVIPKDRGFITKGRKAYSVPFKAFHFQDSIKTLFMCTFLICKDNCDGSSCEHEDSYSDQRTKRAVGEHRNNPRRFVKARSTNMFIAREFPEITEPKGDMPENATMKMLSALAFCLSLLCIVITAALIASRLISPRPLHIADDS